MIESDSPFVPESCELLRKIAALDLTGPIALVLDNDC